MENVHRSMEKTTALPELQWFETPLAATQENVLSPLAWEELACRQVGKGATPILHLWRHPSALVIGHRDLGFPTPHRRWNECATREPRYAYAPRVEQPSCWTEGY